IHTVGTFQVGEYVVFSFLFVVSSGIGIFFAIKERKKASSKEFLGGGRQMSCGPVAFSLTTSFMSAVTVIGGPSDVLRPSSMILTCSDLLFSQYLEMRFCKLVCVAATLIYIIQAILYTGVVVYASALALSPVTGFDLWGSIFATGIVCTFYCTLGSAVVWTDAFQMVVLIQGTSRSGGSLWSTAHTGGRMHVFEYVCAELRHRSFSFHGIFPVQLIKIIFLVSLYLHLLGVWIILFCAVVSVVCYYCCSNLTLVYPFLSQLMPYFVMEILSAFPGLPGLFVTCAFSGTLSTVAASINALATVMYEDFVSQCFRDLSNRAANWINKVWCSVSPDLLAVAASYMGGIVQPLVVTGMCGGPMLGLFSLGILFPVPNLKVNLNFHTRVVMNKGQWTQKKVKPGLTRSMKDVICFCPERFRHTDFSLDKEVKRTLNIPIDFHSISFHTMEVNGNHQLFDYQQSSKYLLLCST
uniref:Solute carrier family 5 member 12 n=1 Tax=Cyprinus carpio TaxID=7962 RepID=A0A8C1W4R5_CYPCA